MLKVALVGCGKIADSHAGQIQRIPGCKIIAVCDREELMARQLCERFCVPESFADLQDLIEHARPDVVHITTPPQSHFPLAKQCLEQGCHVYVEKPFTLYASQAEELVALANRQNLKITVGHDDQFRHGARRMRSLIQNGYLGGAPVHMESYFCYELGETDYTKALLEDKQYWVRQLPGGLLHNIISHGIARISEFFTTDSPQVIAYGFVSPLLRKLGEEHLVDELRVIISEEERISAYFTFSSQMRPSLHQFRIYGPRNGLLLDQDDETVIKLRGARYTSYLAHFVPPMVFANQYLKNWTTNIRTFLARDFHMKSGMHYLISNLYDSIVKGTAPPIPYAEITRTARIMDSIFEQVMPQQRSGLPVTPNAHGHISEALRPMASSSGG
jgi:predicted dehydrogenase